MQSPQDPQPLTPDTDKFSQLWRNLGVLAGADEVAQVAEVRVGEGYADGGAQD